MDPKVTALERAFQLADTGRFATVDKLKKQLDREGYQSRTVLGPVLESQLRNRIKAAVDRGPKSSTDLK
jgi:hypothetical protein